MSFFKHVQLHKYDITDKGITQACYDEMSDAIMFWEDRSLFDELMYRVKRRKWQEEQRNKWLQGEQPEYTVPEDCPF